MYMQTRCYHCNSLERRPRELLVTSLERNSAGKIIYERKFEDAELCDACFEKYNASLKLTLNTRTQLLDYAVLLLKAALIALVLVGGGLYCAKQYGNEHAWWKEGTDAYKRVHSWQGKPCDWEEEHNCEISLGSVVRPSKRL